MKICIQCEQPFRRTDRETPRRYSERLHCSVKCGKITAAHRQAKLKVEDIRAIRAQLALGQFGKDIALRFNITSSTVSAIKTGRVWRDIQ